MADNNSLKDTFNSLKTMIVGTKTSKIDDELDAAIRDISLYRSQTATTSYIDVVKKLVSSSNISNLFDNMSAQDSPVLAGQSSRFSTYKSYEAIIAHISYCKSAIQVITDNILSPDDITKTVLDINMVESFGGDDELKESLTADLNNLIKNLKLERILDTIIKSTLTFGDFFVEIADDKDVMLSTATILTENMALDITDMDSISEETVINSKYDMFEVNLNEDNELLEENNINIILDASSYVDSDKTKKSKNVKLLCYDPKRVVKLQSSLFPICFGYLVFPNTVTSPIEGMKDQAVNTVCVNILNSLKSKVSNFDSEDINKNDLKDMIAKMISRVDTNSSSALRVRYISEDMMQHFTIPSARTYPYGESILAPCQFNAKVYIMLETALAISRLNRSIEKRKINVEIGMPRDAKKAVDAVKNEFNRRKINIDSFGSVDSIPSMISSFEDVYIPQKDGKPYVDVNSFTDAGADSRGKVEELKFMRDSIVSAMGVPSSYINIEENLSNKSALAEENLMFARAIVNYQKLFTEPINELIFKVLNRLKPDKVKDIMEKVIISFPTPKSLQFEREAKYTSDLVSLVQSLSTIGIPIEYAREKYLSNIDWKEVEKFKQTNKIDKNLNVGLDNHNGASPGGDMMGGMGMMPGGYDPNTGM